MKFFCLCLTGEGGGECLEFVSNASEAFLLLILMGLDPDTFEECDELLAEFRPHGSKFG